MKNLLERIKSLFTRKPKEQSAVDEPATQPKANRKQKADKFTLISWAATLILVVGLLGSALYYKSNQEPVIVTIAPTQETSGTNQTQGVEPIVSVEGSGVFQSIFRKLQLKTNIPERERTEPALYRVSRGDTMYNIAETYKVESETILYVNSQLEDNPHSLRPGMELTIPPADGMYYTWKDGDTFESVAEKLYTDPQGIIDFTGNNIDLTNPSVEVGTTIFVPGASRELRNWAADLQTATRGANTGTGGANAANVCGGGPVASGFGWPADSHSLSGNAYGPGHLGIDIDAPEGSNVYAAGTGVVTMAQGGWNYGYGNVVQIDHGNGYVTIYAHLSSIFCNAMPNCWARCSGWVIWQYW
ncbi:MAG: peptidase M23 family protein [Chloroflexi bacterium OLB14]|nr:MAG: peptidase M23 family protein [Chloroflexi bacterium OLB14]